MITIKKVLFLILLLISVLCVGTFGFLIIESNRWSLLEAFYFTLITLTTIGYSEVHTFSENERIFTIFIIIFGVGITYYIISITAQVILEGRLHDYVGKKKMFRAISKLKNHYIICGYGRIGSYICEDLHKIKCPFVVIEADGANISLIKEKGYLYIEGDSTLDSVLIDAGIYKAKALVSVVGNDASSVFITLSGRALNPDIYIVSRYEQEGSDKKLIKAGATKVLSPHIVSGEHMVQLLLKHYENNILDIYASGKLAGFIFEEIEVGVSSRLCNMSLEALRLEDEFSLIIIAILSKGKTVFNPNKSIVLKEKDVLIVFADIDNVKHFKERVQAAKET